MKVPLDGSTIWLFQKFLYETAKWRVLSYIVFDVIQQTTHWTNILSSVRMQLSRHLIRTFYLISVIIINTNLVCLWRRNLQDSLLILQSRRYLVKTDDKLMSSVNRLVLPPGGSRAQCRGEWSGETVWVMLSLHWARFEVMGLFDLKLQTGFACQTLQLFNLNLQIRLETRRSIPV